VLRQGRVSVDGRKNDLIREDVLAAVSI
jgi:hypothetical protein